jgi:hypothetical protein
MMPNTMRAIAIDGTTANRFSGDAVSNAADPRTAAEAANPTNHRSAVRCNSRPARAPR